MWTILVLAFIAVLSFLPIALAVDFIPQGNVNLMNVYKIVNWSAGSCSGTGVVHGIYPNGTWFCQAAGSGTGDVTDVLAGPGITVLNPTGPQPNVSLNTTYTSSLYIGLATAFGGGVIGTYNALFVNWSKGNNNITIMLENITGGHMDIDLNMSEHSIVDIANLTIDGYLEIIEMIRPGTPPANHTFLYVESINDYPILSIIDENGKVTKIPGILPVVNRRGSSIPANRFVYATGNYENVTTIDLAKADNVSTMPAVGITLNAIPDGSFGVVMAYGLLENVNTNVSGFEIGNELYVSDTVAGIAKNTPPVFPNLTQNMGRITVLSTTIGAIQVITGDVRGNEFGTIQNTFIIGNGSAGDKTLSFNALADASIMWDGTKLNFTNNISAPNFLGNINYAYVMNPPWQTGTEIGNCSATGSCSLVLYSINLTDGSMANKHNHSCFNITGGTDSNYCDDRDTYNGSVDFYNYLHINLYYNLSNKLGYNNLTPCADTEILQMSGTNWVCAAAPVGGGGGASIFMATGAWNTNNVSAGGQVNMNLTGNFSGKAFISTGDQFCNGTTITPGYCYTVAQLALDTTQPNSSISLYMNSTGFPSSSLTGAVGTPNSSISLYMNATGTPWPSITGRSLSIDWSGKLEWGNITGYPALGNSSLQISAAVNASGVPYLSVTGLVQGTPNSSMSLYINKSGVPVEAITGINGSVSNYINKTGFPTTGLTGSLTDAQVPNNITLGISGTNATTTESIILDADNRGVYDGADQDFRMYFNGTCELFVLVSTGSTLAICP